MKSVVLLELAKRWQLDAETEGMTEDGSPEAQRGNDIAQGNREGKRECANALKMLIQMLG